MKKNKLDIRHNSSPIKNIPNIFLSVTPTRQPCAECGLVYASQGFQKVVDVILVAKEGLYHFVGIVVVKYPTSNSACRAAGLATI